MGKAELSGSESDRPGRNVELKSLGLRTRISACIYLQY